MSEIPALKRPDPNCPNADGYIIYKAYDRHSKFDEWQSDDGVFLGLIERQPAKPPVYHRLCPVCGGHFFAIGTSPVLDEEQPSRTAPAN